MSPLYPAESAAYRHPNYGRLLAFKLGGSTTPLPPPRQVQQTPAPPEQPAATPEMAQRGAGLFFTYCVFCHGGQGEARLSAYPDLFRMSAPIHDAFQDIVHGGTLKNSGMASFADVLTTDDVTAIHSFLVQGQKALHEMEQSTRN
jgi:quinohemoprotein ethanol dehydrogenase